MRRYGLSVFESLRVHLVCGFEHPAAILVYLIGKSVMDLSRCHQADACMVVLVVVPCEKRLAKDSGILNGAEAFGKLRTVLQVFELGLGDRVVVTDVGAAVGFENPRSTSSSATAFDFMLDPRSACRVNWFAAMFWLLQLCEIGRLAKAACLSVGDHPADHVAAENVDDHVQVKVGPLDRVFQLGDVPGPYLVRPSGQQFWFGHKPHVEHGACAL